MIEKRREKIGRNLKNNEALFLYSGELMYQTMDQTFPFEVQKDYYYLTHLEEPNSVLLMYKINDIVHFIIYKPFTDPKKALWTGENLTPENASLISKISIIKSNENMLQDIKTILKDNKINKLYYVKNQYFTFPFETDLISSLKKFLIVEEFNHIMYKQRLIKDETEILNLKQAIEITNQGLKKVLKQIKNIRTEAEAQSIFEQEVISNNTPLAFRTITGNEINGTTLHYEEHGSELVKDSLLLLDLGAKYKNYCADISRTYPVSGKFSKRQKQLYEIVLYVNETIINYLKPGLNWKDVNEYSKQLMADKLLEINLINNKEEVLNYYYHSIGHPLGLDVHDVRNNDLILEENMVVTVEPGLYIKEEKIGIRIEDDILITKNGAISLSSNILKDVDSIEKFIKKVK